MVTHATSSPPSADPRHRHVASSEIGAMRREADHQTHWLVCGACRTANRPGASRCSGCLQPFGREAASSTSAGTVSVRGTEGSAGSGRWMLLGALVELVIGAIPAAIAGGQDWSFCDYPSVCDRPPTWFESGWAGLLFWASVVLAAVVIPLVVGRVVGRSLWVLICAFVAATSVVVGTALGALAAQRLYPSFFLGDPAGIIVFGAFFGLFLAMVPAALCATIGTVIGKRHRRWG